nr:MAG: hypothetical protein H1BulkLitter41382_000002 [Mitovirus sp.]
MICESYLLSQAFNTVEQFNNWSAALIIIFRILSVKEGGSHRSYVVTTI